MRKTTSLILLLSIITLTLQTGAATAQRPPEPAKGENILNTVTVTLPLSGATFTESKILDAKGNLTAKAVDKNGRPVSAEKLRDEEERLYREKYKKLQPDVYEAVQKRKDTDKLIVGFLLNIPELAARKELKKGDFTLSERNTQALSEKNDREVDAIVKKAAAPLIEQLAKMKRLPEGFDKERSVSTIIPATVTVAELRELAKRSDVASVFLQEEKIVPNLHSSAKTMTVPLLWAYGITGSNVRVAVVGSSRVNFANPLLSPVNGGTLNSGGPIGNDETSAAGIIASGTFTAAGLQHKGIAYGARIYSANDANLFYAMDVAANNTHISSNSWSASCGNGYMDGFAAHADQIVLYKWDGIIGAAGNNPNCYVSTTALGYNTIGVGSYNDNKTGLNLIDDQISSFSTYKNPLFGNHHDIEKPDVSAPGEKIATTINGAPWFSANAGSGTSYAAPMVAGIHALVQQTKPSLTIYPETTKAIILASAVHNIEGAAQLSDKDGAGGVDAKVAYETAVNNRFNWKFLTPSSFGNATTGGSPYYDVNIGPIPPGRRVKVAVDWLSNSPGQNGIDLDLTVFDPQMNSVGGDGRWDDSKELAQFYTTSTVPGNYTVRVYLYSWSLGVPQWTYEAVAWSIS